MSGQDLKVGDVCFIVLSHVCADCQKLQGAECTVVRLASLDVRLSCSAGLQIGFFIVCEVDGKHYNMLRSELRKKDDPKPEDATPRDEFKPADPDFTEELRRQLSKEHA